MWVRFECLSNTLPVDLLIMRWAITLAHLTDVKAEAQTDYLFTLGMVSIPWLKTDCKPRDSDYRVCWHHYYAVLPSGVV